MVRRVLVVDDSAVERTMMVEILSAEGYECLEAPDGERALELAKRHAIDLVITDALMPGMQGDEFITRMHALRQHARTPVLVVTGSPGFVEPSFSRGVLAQIAKPVSADKLIITCQQLLALAKRAATLE